MRSRSSAGCEARDLLQKDDFHQIIRTFILYRQILGCVWRILRNEVTTSRRCSGGCVCFSSSVNRPADSLRSRVQYVRGRRGGRSHLFWRTWKAPAFCTAAATAFTTWGLHVSLLVRQLSDNSTYGA